MDQTYIHLLVNHVPVIGGIGAVLVLAAGMIRRSRDVTVLGLVSLVVVALVAIPVFLTGEPAEDRVENLPGVSRELIKEHEEAAEIAFWAMEVAGSLALLTVIAWRVRRQPLQAGVVVTLIAAIVATALIARAASAGGKIRHTEIRDGAAAAAPAEDHD